MHRHLGYIPAGIEPEQHPAQEIGTAQHLLKGEGRLYAVMEQQAGQQEVLDRLKTGDV